MNFTKQYEGNEILPMKHNSIGEVHTPIINIKKCKDVTVKLSPSWVIDSGAGRSVPTIPGTLNIIPLEKIMSKSYKIK